MLALPETFILYNPARASSDPYCGLTYINTTNVQAETMVVATLSRAPVGQQMHIQQVPNKNGNRTFYGSVYINDKNGLAQYKKVYDWTNWMHITTMSGGLVPVLQIKVRPSEHFSYRLNRNVTFTLMPPLLIPDNLINNNLISQNANPNIIQHVSPQPIQRKRTPIRHGPPSINPFVAKQLLTLAKQTKDMCPITAEEFMDGHTAAMPCGHLFMQMAIEESFKVRPNECPLCRLAGMPTFV